MTRPFLPINLRTALRMAVMLAMVPACLRAQDGASATRNLYWSDITVTADLDADGRLHVVERQSMVFDGAWNGGERSFNVRHGQVLRLARISRIDAATGARTDLVEGDLDAVDEYNWVAGTLRWRSRLPSDPPFRFEEIVYELEYTLWPVLETAADGDYLLRHDFAFPDRVGPIQQFGVDLTLDPVWRTSAGQTVSVDAQWLEAGRGYVLTLPLEYVGTGRPEAVPAGAPGLVRSGVALAALLIPVLVAVGLLRRGRELDEEAPLAETDTIDEDWLRRHIFRYPPEMVGAAWDRSIGQAEVAALLARLVGEGKLTSRVEVGKDAVLHLRRVAPLSSFEPHERDLLNGLFFDGGEETDTESIREHYKKSGFDPSSYIRPELTRRMESLPGEGRRQRNYLPGMSMVGAGVACALLLPDRPGRFLIAAVGVALAVAIGALALAVAAELSRRVVHRRLMAVILVVVIAVGGILLALLATGAFEREGGLVFYRPGSWLLIGLAIVLAGIGVLIVTMAQPTETAERLAFRRRLASARRYFAEQLEREQPELKDAWFPYLLAFGLGPQIDRWFRSFAAPDSATRRSGMVAAGGMAGSSVGSGGASSGWSGGGPQFGGGSWGGGGAGGTWSAAAVGLAAGVSAPSSSSGGGGGSGSSGGGGGGGW